MKIFFALLALGLFLPTITLAGFPFWPSATNPILTCTGGGPRYENFAGGIPGRVQCLTICDALETSQNIISAIMTYTVFILAPIFFAWGGILILTDGGSSARLGQGKKILKGTGIGLAITLCSFIIVQTFLFALGQVTITGQTGSGSSVQWGNISCTNFQSWIPGQTPAIPITPTP